MTKYQMSSIKYQIRKQVDICHLIFVMCLLAFAVRLYRLDGQGFWSDEFLAVWRARLPLPQMLTENMPAEHVPLYFVLLHFWLQVSGDTDFTVRFLPAAFSLLVVPFAYRLALEVWRLESGAQSPDLGPRTPDSGLRLGLLVAFLLAISPFQVWYAQENRMYSLLTAAGSASLVFLLRGLRRGGRWTWIGYVLTTAVAIYTHYYAFLLVAAEALFVAWWVARRKAEAWRPWLAAMGVVAMLFLPWVPSATRLFTHRGWRQGADVLALPGRFIAAYSVGTSVPPAVAAWLTIGFICLFTMGVVASIRRSSTTTWLLVLLLGVPLAGGMLLALRQPDFHERYFIFVTPIYFLAIAAGIARLGQAAPVLGTIALVFVGITDAYSLYNHYFDPAYAKVDYRAVAQYLQERVQPEDGIVPNGPEIGYVARYFQGDLPPYYDNVAGEYFVGKGGADYVVPLLQDMARQHPRVWLLWKWGGAPYVKDWFDQHGFQIGGEWVSDVRVYLYSFPTPTTTALRSAPDLKTNGEITLTGYRIEPESIPSGAVIHLTLFWEAVKPPARNYKVALRLLDPAGRAVAALDRPPLDGAVPTSAWYPGQRIEDRYGLQLPPGTPPVNHVLQVKVYDPDTSTEILSTQLAPISVVRPAQPPDPARVPVQHRVRVTANDRLELVGYEWPTDDSMDRKGHGQILDEILSVFLSIRGASPAGGGVRPGESIPITVLWRTLAPGIAGWQVRLTLAAPQGITWEQTQALNPTWPPERWQAGDLIRAVYDLPIPAAATGNLRLALELLDASGNILGQMVLGSVTVQARARKYQVPRISYPVEATLGEQVRFLGYDLDRERVAPGKTLGVTLYWQALGTGSTPVFDKSYTVFVHLLDTGGAVRGQKDNPPLEGTAPTTSWLPGEVLADPYTIPVDSDAPPGDYIFEVGLYDPATGQRLPVQDAQGNPLPENRILLDQVRVQVGGGQ